ncbi:MAG: GNAT family N-acetyltransferase [Alkalispirochaeta sp.]
MADSIISLATLTGTLLEAATRGAEAIFWETAHTTSFESEEERSGFQWRYFGYYLEHAPEMAFVAYGDVDAADRRNGDSPLPLGNSRVLGYICGVVNTRAHRALYEIAPHVPVFDNLYDRYPAHLHINLTAAARGRGLGGTLLRAIEERARLYGAPGIHLVTSVGARNVGFYRKNGYTDAWERPLNAAPEMDRNLLFLGKRL